MDSTMIVFIFAVRGLIGFLLGVVSPWHKH